MVSDNPDCSDRDYLDCVPMSSYPVNLELSGQPVLVVGGGPVAARKVAGLQSADARVTVVSPSAVREISADPDIRWLARPYQPGEVASYRLAITATDDPAVNAEVRSDGDKANVFVNSADDPSNCSFTLPAVARRGDLQITVSTGGRSPGLARWLRQRLEGQLSESYDELLVLLTEARAEARALFGTSEIAGWDTALNDGLLELVQQNRITEARERLWDHLGLRAQGVLA
ncbi:MAG: bifunctional precorrin-2 dehydrogenase/sirohydrochlorin ferrochelatase [Acidimicrobiaceae bacterium]|nr:bifunctional precorrin-2 dehydrogenase/sirohydrochlorin ferrochelatase [Acidimicrobiaceae bacterium]MXW76867.1 bifunctional precorrin-2 dehydrogenase/sirohydrochlorin ferrochelatase [Acidimicrobiaceae bacterium]MYA74448.1 bifunctional precorrin-2 dehydrogenase/sirohydrochlorin ferrochelatase [Acidimicrobiaceae bacterium]MYC41554.1 bifunctional precorrin-2 dehydrogenase/sirohydrochlorin ferrochelatase [Acidimicrobiaceae bacterium]MYD05530.1 bifunctional precorrin-2 dehydrogenase/sirohydrochlo